MAKRGLFIGNINPILRDISRKRGWALCIGAGTSYPMFPNWSALVNRLIGKGVGNELAQELTNSLLEKYSPDALIQAAHDRLNLSDEEFVNILSGELYANLQTKLSESEWDLFTRIISANLGEYRRSEWLKYLLLIRKYYPEISALMVAEVISEYLDTEFSPSSILSFNAEPLLPSLINAYVRINRVTKAEASKSYGKQFDLVTHSISNRNALRIPYYFIHGLLPVPSELRKRRIIDSPDKLVFSETEYLQLANNTFSWQSSVFLDVAASNSLVFIGVSLSDPNMRRWLSWIHLNRRRELEILFSARGPSTAHYWITKHPGSANEREWIEASVEHLGIRLIWIYEWSEVGRALRSMLELPI